MIRKPANSSSRGFTFVEVTAALAILAVALVVLLDGAHAGTEAFMRTRELARAQAWARQGMTHARLNEEIPLDGDVEDCELDLPDVQCKIYYDTAPGLQELIQLTTLADSQQQTTNRKPPIAYFIIRVVVTWGEDGYEQEYELRSGRLYQLTEEEQRQ